MIAWVYQELSGMDGEKFSSHGFWQTCGIHSPNSSFSLQDAQYAAPLDTFDRSITWLCLV